MTYLGRVIGRSVRQLRFRALYEGRFQLGEIVVVEDEEQDRQLLARVVDIEYGADAMGADWCERTAGSMMQSEGGFELRDRERRLYSVGVCTPLGFITPRNFKRAKALVPHFSRVRRAGVEDFEFLRSEMGEVEVGVLRSGERLLDIPVGVDARKTIPHHIGVFATTGMGKSNLMKTMIASAMRLGRCGMLVFDPHGEYYAGQPGYKGLRDLPWASEGLEHYSTRAGGHAHTDVRISAHEIGVYDLLSIREYSEPQKDAMHAFRARFGEGWLVEVEDLTAEELYDIFEGRHWKDTINVIKRRARQYLSSPLVSRDPAISITRAVLRALRSGRVVLVDLSGTREEEELLVSTVLARAVFEDSRRLYTEPEEFDAMLPVLITIEEAQRVLRTPHATIFAQIAREGRKFKLGLCAISQQPKLINAEILSQFNTLFIMGLADRRDREILRDAAKQEIGDLENEIQTLMVGEALLTSPFVPFAVPVHVHKYEDYLQAQSASQPGKRRAAGADQGFFG
ncbi:MAG: ATP-binding protein [Candidatus Thermoplasmatota archaeon]